MTPVFGHGALRLYLLSLLAEAPRHGYELMQALEHRFGGTYSPSAGTIYPRLSKLEEEGLLTKAVERLHQLVAVAVSLGEREQDLERDFAQGQEVIDLVFHCSRLRRIILA